MMEVIELKLDEVVYRKDLYPRIDADKPEITRTIQKYAENIDVLPPIEVNQHNILIDGYHRWTAHRKMEAETIKAIVTETASEVELFAFAIERNAAHGHQLSERSKKFSAVRLYAAGTGMDKDEICSILSVTKQMVNRYLSDIDKQRRKDRKEKIEAMYLACHTMEEIAVVVGLTKQQISSDISTLSDNETSFKNGQSPHFNDDFETPIYNVWSFGKKTNSTTHFGNTEQRIVDNLVYLYTKPFDIVVDPFAGGGATIDICKSRLRRYYVSDRKPIPEREEEIRTLDIVTDSPGLNRLWSDVTLTYLDPPYWRQAQNKYSEDEEDLANMPLEMFTKNMVDIVNKISKKQSKGAIALIIQPTQWNTDENHTFTDHVMDICVGVSKNKKLRIANRAQCPYSSEQCMPQMVNWAKENKRLLVLSRELIIWEFV